MTKRVDKKSLRTGYTTGTCAAAAAKGAAMILLGARPKAVEIKLLLGDTATILLKESRIKDGTAYCTVVKDAGDDPDDDGGHHPILESDGPLDGPLLGQDRQADGGERALPIRRQQHHRGAN